MSLLPAPVGEVLAQIGPGALICGLPDLDSLFACPLLFIMSLLRLVSISFQSELLYQRDLAFFGRPYTQLPGPICFNVS